MKPLVTRVVILTSLALLSACSQDDAPRSLSPEAANLPVPADLPDAGMASDLARGMNGCIFHRRDCWPNVL